MPQLLDPNFKRTVVLLVHYDEEGALGLVLNRPSEVPVESLCASLGIDWHGGALQVDWGGPVQPNTGWVLFGEEPGDGFGEMTEISERLHFAGSLLTLRRVAEQRFERLRIFLGYAGWGAGQLEAELVQGAWLLAPISPHSIFGVPAERMWEEVIRSLGVDPSTLVPTPGIH